MHERHETLLEMLRYRRPHGSKTERKFINRFIRPLGVTQDGYGNLIKRIGDAPVLYSCHTDSVHRVPGKQGIAEDKSGIITQVGSTCLGADNVTGVWIMREMILANRPGLYIFHREEESGALGSTWIAENTPALVDGIKYAIAFDRRGTKSIITHQWVGRTCSDEFGTALATALDLDHELDPTGSLTDTASYYELIPECTNISAGFFNEHTSTESLNSRYLHKLLDAMLKLDVTTLPASRDPKDVDFDYGKYVKVAGGWSGYFDDDDQEPASLGYNGHGLSHWEKLRDVVRYYPDLVADYLESMGVNAEDIMDELGRHPYSYEEVA